MSATVNTPIIEARNLNLRLGTGANAVQHLEQGRLSRSGLTDDAETLTAGNGEVDVVQGLDGVGTGAESQVEIPRLKDRGVHGGAHRSSSTIGWPGSTASSRAARSRRRV